VSSTVCCIYDGHRIWGNCNPHFLGTFASLGRLAPRHLPVVLTYGGPTTLFALRPLPAVLVDALPAALLALRPDPPVLAEGGLAALLAARPDPNALADL